LKKIKIVFIQHQLVCGGAEQALFDLICLMDKTKFDITVLTLVGDGEWEDKFKKAGIPVVNIFYKRKKDNNPVRFLRHQLRKLKVRWLMKVKPKKLLTYLIGDGIDISVAYSFGGFEEVAMVENAKYVKYVHGDIETYPIYRDTFLRIKNVLPKYNRIICVSEKAYEAFKRITGVEENVEMHFNPINSDNVRQLAEQRISIPEDMPYICAVGRLSPEKGYDRLIRIHKKILDQGIAHKLIIVGDGPEKESLFKTVQEIGVLESVYLVGYQPNPYPYMKHSCFVVCSSYTEGLPVIAMEALSLGIPVVSAVPSIAEAFGVECCGIITENDDDSLESGIKKMLEDQVFYEKAKQGAINRSDFFDGKRMVKEIENIFIELMEGKKDGFGQRDCPNI